MLQELYESAELLNEGLLILKRIERQAGPILSGAQANLAGAIGADRQSGAALVGARHPRPFTFPSRSHEPSEIDLGAQGARSGKWYEEVIM